MSNEPDADLIEMLRGAQCDDEAIDEVINGEMGQYLSVFDLRALLAWSNARRDSAVADRDTIIQELHWMARRYCDGRMSGVSATFNALTRTLLRWGLKLQEPLFARDGMGRRYDYLSNEEAAAAEADMPNGHAVLQKEWQARAMQLVADRDATIARLREALEYWISAHETGRFEPSQIAYENAKNILADASLATENDNVLTETRRSSAGGE